jgi:hypothetical protein
MTNQTKPGAMVLAIANEMNRLGYGFHESHAESIWLAIQAEQPPAVGGELEVFRVVRNPSINGPWRLADKAAFDCAGTLPKYERMELIDRAHVAPLLAEIERWKTAHEQICENYNKASFASEERGKEIECLQSRIAQLEAAQGEAVAWEMVAVGEDGEVYRRRHSKSRSTDKDALHAWGQGVLDRFKIEHRPLYRQARPATAKVALPDRVDIELERSQPNSWDDHGMGWNACLDEVAKLNGGA